VSQPWDPAQSFAKLISDIAKRIAEWHIPGATLAQIEHRQCAAEHARLAAKHFLLAHEKNKWLS
jgi:hypothetical protein